MDGFLGLKGGGVGVKTGSGDGVPSFYELCLLRGLQGAAGPALRHSLRTAMLAASSSLGSSSWAGGMREDALVLAALLGLEALSLWQCDALWTEALYGFVRRRRKRGREGDRLQARDRVLALVISVLLPFLKEKADRWFQQHVVQQTEEEVHGREGPESGLAAAAHTARRSAETVLLRIYPWIHAGWQGVVMFLHWRCLFEEHSVTPTSSFSPQTLGLATAGQVLRRGGSENNSKASDSASSTTAEPAATESEGVIQRMSSGWTHWYTTAAVAWRVVVLLLFVALKLSQWTRSVHLLENATRGTAQRGATDGREDGNADQTSVRLGDSDTMLAKTIPPPGVPQIGRGCVVPPADPALCPLCRQPRQNPACAPDGYLFCLTCLATHIREHGRSPVSGLPCTIDSIVRIYDTNPRMEY